jgi:hypothetical protein
MIGICSPEICTQKPPTRNCCNCFVVFVVVAPVIQALVQIHVVVSLGRRPPFRAVVDHSADKQDRVAAADDAAEGRHDSKLDDAAVSAEYKHLPHG